MVCVGVSQCVSVCVCVCVSLWSLYRSPNLYRSSWNCTSFYWPGAVFVKSRRVFNQFSQTLTRKFDLVSLYFICFLILPRPPLHLLHLRCPPPLLLACSRDALKIWWRLQSRIAKSWPSSVKNPWRMLRIDWEKPSKLPLSGLNSKIRRWGEGRRVGGETFEFDWRSAEEPFKNLQIQRKRTRQIVPITIEAVDN